MDIKNKHVHQHWSATISQFIRKLIPSCFKSHAWGCDSADEADDRIANLSLMTHLCWPCIRLLQATTLDLCVKLLVLWVDAGTGGIEEPAQITLSKNQWLPEI
jgi:hypothetical protein